MKLVSILTLSLVMLLQPSIQAHEIKKGNLAIIHPWAKASRAGQTTGSGYFVNVKNSGATADALIGVKANISKSVELHNMVMEKEVMKMFSVPSIAIPANGKAEIIPGKYHIMFIDLKKPLVKGESFPATLIFKNAGEIAVDFTVEDENFKATPGVMPPAPQHQHHQQQ